MLFEWPGWRFVFSGRKADLPSDLCTAPQAVRARYASYVLCVAFVLIDNRAIINSFFDLLGRFMRMQHKGGCNSIVFRRMMYTLQVDRTLPKR